MSETAQYLVRFDDICPTMNWRRWEEIEAVLEANCVRPLLAVVPDNLDPKLQVDPPRSDFWERVRDWQHRGYTIALHGYQHVYVNSRRGIMGLTPHSEFAGVPAAEQERKLRAGVAIFAEHQVRAEAWIAPSHSFDWTTVGLLPRVGIKVISDGLWPWPHTDERGISWVPQQLWRTARRGPGVWTICHHHNHWTQAYFDEFQRGVEDLAPQMTNLPEVLSRYAPRRLTLRDRWASALDLTLKHRTPRSLRRLALALYHRGLGAGQRAL